MQTYQVKLISITKPIVEGITTPEEFIAYTARVSNPTNQLNNATAPKLVKYLLEQKHFSPFEQVDLGIEIETSRGIAPQILRHWSFSFQEFCVSGDTLITTVLPRKDKITPHYIPIKKLFERQKWRQYKGILLRVYDEVDKKFTRAPLKEVFFTGVKPCFRVVLNDGKEIACTKEHKFLTRDGFKSLEDLANLRLNGKTASMLEPMEVAVNGDVCYRNRDWLESAKRQSIANGTGLLGISEAEGNVLVPRFVGISRIEYVGDVDTYDLEVDHPSHNYVANKILVHNSQRYSEVMGYIEYPARRQDPKNRQNSVDDLPEETKEWFLNAQCNLWAIAHDFYRRALEKGIAKEQARFLLTENAKTRLFMKGNLRDWIFYLQLRSGNGTQQEHMDIANAVIKEIFVPNFPVISSVLGWA